MAKKPLLVRNALPEIAHLLEPSDVIELALEEDVTARLIKQKDRDPNQWTVKSSPLIKADFQKCQSCGRYWYKPLIITLLISLNFGKISFYSAMAT